MAAELPGVKADDLEITFEDGLLTIQGERRFGHDSAEEKMHRTERYYGAFRRSITLPSHVEADKIEASVQDGVLQILVPKAPDVQAKRIRVRAGQGHLPHPRRNDQGRQVTAEPRPPAKDRHLGRGTLPPSPLNTAVTAGGTRRLASGTLRCRDRDDDLVADHGRVQRMPQSGRCSSSE